MNQYRVTMIKPPVARQAQRGNGFWLRASLLDTAAEHRGCPAGPTSSRPKGKKAVGLDTVAERQDAATGRSRRLLAWRGWSAAGQVSRIGGTASWHVLGQPRFRRYFVGSLISNLGTWLQNTAQVLLAYQLTHSALAVGAVTCAQFSSSVLLGPWAAALADRLDGRRLLIGTQLLSAGIAGGLAMLTFSGILTERALIIGALGLGLAFAFALPLQTSMVPRLVPEADTKAAMAMNSVSYNAGRAVAPVLCVLVGTVVGLGWAFSLNAVSFIVFAATLLFVRPDRAEQPAQRPAARTGISIAARRPRIMLLLAMVAAVTVVEDPVLVLGPSLARQMHALSSIWPGYFLSALGLGTVLGACLPTRRLASSERSASERAAWSLLLLASCMIAFTWGFDVWISMAAAVGAGVAGLLTGSAVQSLLLRIAGPHLAAKVMAMWAIAWAGSKPIASLTDGWLAGTVGIRSAGILLAAPALAIALLELLLPSRIKASMKDWLKVRLSMHDRTRTVIQSH
jgi:predicted MFS family arabinose efflux permease